MEQLPIVFSRNTKIWASIPVDLARGEYISAGLSAFGAFPVVGEVADTAKIAKKVDKAVDISKVSKTAIDFKSFPKKIHIGKQGKHILGHNNYQKGKSILNISTSDAQKLINQYSGKGRKIGTIHYSKSGTHLVPEKPINWRK